MYIIGFICLSMMKARTSLLAIIIVTVLFLFKYTKLNSLKKIIYAIGFIIASTPFWGTIKNIIIRGFNIDFITASISGYLNINSLLDLILSGRMEHYRYALILFSNNPLLGARFDIYSVTGMLNSTVGIHSSLMRSLGYGGIVYFLLILILMGSYIFYLFKDSIDKNILKYTLIIGMVGMLFEPFAPFGPGTTYLLFWLILGFYSKKRKKVSCE